MVEEAVNEQPKRGNDKLVRIILGLAAVLFVGIVGVAAFAIGRETSDKTEAAPDTSATVAGQYNYDILNEIRGLLDRYYVRPENLDDQTLFEGAVNGMLDVLSDSGTYYVDPDTNQRSTLLTGSFEGIGATISSDNDEIVIVAPIKGTPGRPRRSGVRRRDRGGRWRIDDRLVDGPGRTTDSRRKRHRGHVDDPAR